MNVPLASPGAKKRVLVVDDHPVIRASLAGLINGQDDLACCGEADSPAAVFDAVARLRPDLILLDLWLGDMDGLELLKSIHAQFPEQLILVVSGSDEKLYAERSLRAGARGYLTKTRTPQELRAGIRAVLQGELCLSREMTGLLMRKAIQAEPEAQPAMVGTLSDRELHIFQLLGRGLATRTIAAQLNLSTKTIEAHRVNIKHKLGFASPAALVQAAIIWVRSSAAPALTECAAGSPALKGIRRPFLGVTGDENQSPAPIVQSQAT
jgi:DNA-binding NarL/FixJ family response regulator